VCLRLKNGAGHAISLDFGKDRIYDSAGGDYDCAELRGGLCRLLESGAKVDYAGKLMITEPSKTPPGRKCRSSRKKQKTQ